MADIEPMVIDRTVRISFVYTMFCVSNIIRFRGMLCSDSLVLSVVTYSGVVTYSTV